jgi:hypothetical protein
MQFDESIRAFERAVDAQDQVAILEHAASALRWIRLAAAEKGRPPVEIAAEIQNAAGGLAGFFAVQEALRNYVNRPSGPVELVLSSVYGRSEDAPCVAIFDDEDAAMAYFRSCLLPMNHRYTDSAGKFRSFRSDSPLYNYNPFGGNGCEDGQGVLRVALPWNLYRGDMFSAAPLRNPAPMTGDLPPTPSDAKLYAESVPA